VASRNSMQRVNVFQLGGQEVFSASPSSAARCLSASVSLRVIPELVILAHGNPPIRHGTLAILARYLAQTFLRSSYQKECSRPRRD